MNAEDVKHVGHGQEPMIALDDEADEAASHMAGMSKHPKILYQSIKRY